MKNISWAVLGTGVIANEMANALKKNGKNIYAVGNRTYEKAVAFGEKYGIKKVYSDYNEMFTDPDVDVIYITTPHNTHINFVKKAIENGKHVLIEKSITLNSDELSEIVSMAKEKGVVIAEAMTIYHMPVYTKLREILASGKLGKVNLITMNFGSFKEYDMNNRFFNRNLAGGAMLDIGVYALSFIRWFMESKPDNIQSQVKLAPTGVDEQVGMLLTNKEGQMATVMLSLHSKQPKRGMVSCEKGYIEIMEYPRAWEAKITYTDSGETEIIKAGNNADALAYELSDMEKAINGDENCMHLDYTTDVMDMMTEFRKTWNLSYPEETTTAKISPSANIVKESTIMGDVTVGENCTILFYAVLRGNDNKIVVGDGTNIQDNCTLHTSLVDPVILGKNVTVGHNAIVHGCRVGDNTLIGMGATIMNGTVIGKNCLIAAGSLVLEHQSIPDGSLVMGSPAKVKRKLTDDEIKNLENSAAHYIETGRKLREQGYCV